MRLIDADALAQALHEAGTVMGQPHFLCRTVYECINNAPIVDAVPVVRCKDCKWQDKGENESESWNICAYRPWSYKSIEDTDFCSDGKRRNRNDE